MLTHLKMPNDKRRYQLSWGVHPLKKSREAVDIFRTGGESDTETVNGFSSRQNKESGVSRTTERTKNGTNMEIRDLMEMRKEMRTRLGWVRMRTN